MKISRTSLPSPRTFEKSEKLNSVFIKQMMAFFNEKSYGNSVKEIQYDEILVPDELGEDGSSKIIYKDQTIHCIIQPDYKKIASISFNKFIQIMAKNYLESSKQFKKLNIEGFDVDGYINDFESFFKKLKLI